MRRDLDLVRCVLVRERPRGPRFLTQVRADRSDVTIPRSADGAALPDGFDLSRLGSPRMVVDNRFSEMTDEVAAKTILEQMDYLTSTGDFEFSEAVLITKDGELRRLQK